MTLLEDVHSHLSEKGVAHALIGAAALAAHGVSRSTVDRDLLVTDRYVLDAHFWAPLASRASADIRVGDADDPLAGVVRITRDVDRDVDVIVGCHAWQATAIARARVVGASQIPVVQAVDLILLKLYAGGSQDRWDIEQLLAVSNSIGEAVDAQVGALPSDCQRLWRLLRSETAG